MVDERRTLWELCPVASGDIHGKTDETNVPHKCAHLLGTAFPLASPLEGCFRYLKKLGEEAEGLR